MRFNFYTLDGIAVATSHLPLKHLTNCKDILKKISINTCELSPGNYYMKIVAFEPTYSGSQIRHDEILSALTFSVSSKSQLFNLNWDNKYWGNVVFEDAEEII